MIWGVEKLTVAIDPFDTVVSAQEHSWNIKNQSIEAHETLEDSFAYIFPLLTNMGFGTAAGIYLMTPVADKEQKTRSILSLSGLTSLQYYTGLFIADYVLFIIPAALLSATIVIL